LPLFPLSEQHSETLYISQYSKAFIIQANDYSHIIERIELAVDILRLDGYFDEEKLRYYLSDRDYSHVFEIILSPRKHQVHLMFLHREGFHEFYQTHLVDAANSDFYMLDLIEAELHNGCEDVKDTASFWFEDDFGIEFYECNEALAEDEEQKLDHSEDPAENQVNYLNAGNNRHCNENYSTSEKSSYFEARDKVNFQPMPDPLRALRTIDILIERDKSNKRLDRMMKVGTTNVALRIRNTANLTVGTTLTAKADSIPARPAPPAHPPAEDATGYDNELAPNHNVGEGAGGDLDTKVEKAVTYINLWIRHDSASPSAGPSAGPSPMPSSSPSTLPSPSPSEAPSGLPSASPSSQPSATPSLAPSSEPSSAPSVFPYPLDLSGDSTIVNAVSKLIGPNIIWTSKLGRETEKVTQGKISGFPIGTVLSYTTLFGTVLTYPVVVGFHLFFNGLDEDEFRTTLDTLMITAPPNSDENFKFDVEVTIDNNKEQFVDSYEHSVKVDCTANTQQVLLRGAQVHEWIIAKKDKEIAKLKAQLEELTFAEEKEVKTSNTTQTALQTTVAEQQEQLLVLQITVEKQEKTINLELRLIKSIAMKRANLARSVEMKAVTASPDLKPRRTSYVTEMLSSSLTSMSPGAPPQIPSRKSSQIKIANTIGSSNHTSDEVAASSVPQEASTSSALLREESTGSASLREDPPKLPIRQFSSQDDISMSTMRTNLKFKSPVDQEQNRGVGRNISFNNQENNTPPALPQRQASQDTRWTNSSDMTNSHKNANTTTEVDPNTGFVSAPPLSKGEDTQDTRWSDTSDLTSSFRHAKIAPIPKLKFTLKYESSSAARISRLRGIPPIAGKILWAKQMECQVNTLMERMSNVSGPNWGQHLEGRQLRKSGDELLAKLDAKSFFRAWITEWVCCRHCQNLQKDTFSCRSFSSAPDNLASAISNSFSLHLQKCSPSAKGLGALKTFWLEQETKQPAVDNSSDSSEAELKGDTPPSKQTEVTARMDLDTEHGRNVDWMTEVLSEYIPRGQFSKRSIPTTAIKYSSPEGKICLDEVVEVLHLPQFDGKGICEDAEYATTDFADKDYSLRIIRWIDILIERDKIFCAVLLYFSCTVQALPCTVPVHLLVRYCTGTLHFPFSFSTPYLYLQLAHRVQ
jgi:hypothetical protein